MRTAAALARRKLGRLRDGGWTAMAEDGSIELVECRMRAAKSWCAKVSTTDIPWDVMDLIGADSDSFCVGTA